LSSNKEDNRNKFPEVAKIVDKFTEIFGKVKVIYAEEGGNTVGKKAEDGIPADQIILEKIDQEKLQERKNQIENILKSLNNKKFKQIKNLKDLSKGGSGRINGRAFK
jgi:hypothetical protein